MTTPSNNNNDCIEKYIKMPVVNNEIDITHKPLVKFADTLDIIIDTSSSEDPDSCPDADTESSNVLDDECSYYYDYHHLHPKNMCMTCNLEVETACTCKSREEIEQFDEAEYVASLNSTNKKEYFRYKDTENCMRIYCGR